MADWRATPAQLATRVETNGVVSSLFGAPTHTFLELAPWTIAWCSASAVCSEGTPHCRSPPCLHCVHWHKCGKRVLTQVIYCLFLFFFFSACMLQYVSSLFLRCVCVCVCRQNCQAPAALSWFLLNCEVFCLLGIVVIVLPGEKTCMLVLVNAEHHPEDRL